MFTSAVDGIPDYYLTSVFILTTRERTGLETQLNMQEHSLEFETVYLRAFL